MYEQPSAEKFFSHVSKEMMRVELSGIIALTTELSDTRVQEINLYFPDDVFATWAANETVAAINLDDDDNRRKFLCGQSISYFKRDDDLILFVKAVSDITDKIDKEIYYSRDIC